MASKEDAANKVREASLKRAAKFLKDMEGSTKKQSSYWGDISNAVLGLDKSDFFSKVEHSPDFIAELKQQFMEMQDVIKDAGVELDTSFGKAIKGKKTELNSLINAFAEKSPEMADALKGAVKSANISEFMLKFGDEGLEAFQKIVKDKEGFDKLNKFFKDSPKKLQDTIKATKALDDELKSVGRTTLDIGKAFGKLLENITSGFRPDKIKDAILSFDQTITTAQRDFGIAFKDNAGAMSELTTKTAQFGLSVEDTANLMGKLGEGLRTTDFGVLAKAADDMAAISKATGVSINDIGELGSQMILFGKTSEDVSKFAENTMKSAMNFGVNGKKIMSDIAKNLPKFRQMGFQGGEESLKKMAIQAERLGQNIDEIFDVAKRARTIEGSLDMAAQLQLAGGSFANINPMDLLSAARKGPDELQKILSKMGADIGAFNEKTGEMKFSAVDVDRLQIAADATGMSIDSLQKQITKAAQDNQKTKLLPPGLFEGLNPEEQAFLANSMKMRDGKLISIGVEGVTDLAKLTPKMIQSAMEKTNADRKTLAEQAEQNMSFEESVKALKGSIMNIFTFLEPIVKDLTGVIQKFTGWVATLPVWGKYLIAGLAATLTLIFGPAKQFLSGIAFGKGHKAGLEGGGFLKMLNPFSKGKGGMGGKMVPEGTENMKGAPGGFLTSFAMGIKSFGQVSMKDLLKFGAAMAITGLALVGFTVAIAKMGGEASFKQLITAGGALVLLGGSLFLLSKISSKIDMGGVLKGAIAMGILGLSLIPFAFAAQMFQQTDWETFAKMAVVMVGGILSLMAIGALLSGPQALLFIIGAAALAGAGLSLMLFGAAMNVAATGFQKMSAIDWKSFGNMGTALMMIIPGLMALGGVGLFALPGLFMMTGVLAGLASVMVVLAPALSMASQSMIMMAEGVEKLKTAVKGLDTDKLESLAGISERLAVASAIGGLANAINALAGGGGGGGAGTGKQQTMRLEPITINLKMNGRDIQREVVEATAHIT